MDLIKFKELVKIAADQLKYESIAELTQNDSAYQELKVQEEAAEKTYLELDLTEKQRNICNQFLDTREKENSEYATLAYISGLKDAFRMIYAFFPKEYSDNDSSAK